MTPLWIAAALLAYFVKGLCGFANTLVFSTMLSFTGSHVNISPVELLLGYPTNLIIAWKERRALNLRLCLPLCALVLLGCIPGAFLLKNADTGMIKTLFGFTIVFIALESLWRDLRPKKSRQSGALLAVIGLLSGILCGLYGVGALLGAYLSRVTEDSRSFKANLCVVFAAENTFRIALYLFWGILTPAIAMRALALSLVMLTGLFLGMRCSKVISEKLAKRIVILALLLSGVALIITSL